jgi:hypothetical protein
MDVKKIDNLVFGPNQAKNNHFEKKKFLPEKHSLCPVVKSKNFFAK